MTDNKPPAFQFYVREWRSSRAVQRMTFAQRGMYFEMLCEQWDKGSLPDCPRACADLLGGTEAEWLDAWPVLRRKFVDRRYRPRKNEVEPHIPTDHDPSRRIINLRLERCRADWERFKKDKSEAGRKGGRANAQRIKEIADKQSLSTAEAEPKQNEAEPKPSLLCSASASALPKRKSAGGMDDPEIKAIASELSEIYPEVYAACRSGAVYRTTQITHERDWPNYYALAELYPDIRRLRAMLEIFLRRDLGEKNNPGTPGQFRHMAPMCDEVLNRSGWRAA